MMVLMGRGMAFYSGSDIQIGGAYPDIGLRRLVVRGLRYLGGPYDEGLHCRDFQPVNQQSTSHNDRYSSYAHLGGLG